MKNFTLALLLSFFTYSLSAQFTSVEGTDLNWNDPDTWVDAQVPNLGPGAPQNLRTITIPEGSFVLLDGDITSLANLELYIAGSLSINNLTANNNLLVDVADGGVFTVKGDITYRNNTQIIVNGELFADSVVVSTSGSNATGCIGGSGSIRSNDEDGTAPWVPENIVIPCLGMENPFPVIALAEPGLEHAATTDNIELFWTTAKEDNSAFFTIQRSTDNAKWLPVGNILEAAGERTAYEFTDEYPFEGTSWYRLRLTDINGKFSFSEVEEASWTAKDLNFKVLKDPGTWTIRFPVIGQYIVEAYTLHGRRILVDQVEQTVTMPAPDGAVVIRVTNNKERTASRVVM
ncbi:MAG: hypothetical protein V2I46_09150 [Bacteroides sp.]|jgi:hypothetical protein|nr:hypothetical protein [Bacteroides sp.]